MLQELDTGLDLRQINPKGQVLLPWDPLYYFPSPTYASIIELISSIQILEIYFPFPILPCMLHAQLYYLLWHYCQQPVWILWVNSIFFQNLMFYEDDSVAFSATWRLRLPKQSHPPNTWRFPNQKDCNLLQYLLLLLADFIEVWLLPYYQNKLYCERGGGLRRVKDLIGKKAQETIIKCLECRVMFSRSNGEWKNLTFVKKMRWN